MSFRSFQGILFRIGKRVKRRHQKFSSTCVYKAYRELTAQQNNCEYVTCYDEPDGYFRMLTSPNYLTFVCLTGSARFKDHLYPTRVNKFYLFLLKHSYYKLFARVLSLTCHNHYFRIMHPDFTLNVVRNLQVIRNQKSVNAINEICVIKALNCFTRRSNQINGSLDFLSYQVSRVLLDIRYLIKI